MTEHVTSSSEDESIEVPLTVGSRVALIEESEIEVRDGEVAGGYTGYLFEDFVDKWIPETNLLEFENSDVGYSEFMEMVEEADGITVINEEEVKSIE